MLQYFDNWGIGDMYYKTLEYLEELEKTPKKERTSEKFNLSKIFKAAQNGDMEAFNYLYKINEYLIDEILSECTQFIKTNIDIQVYKDLLTDTLIRSIKEFDPSQLVAFRSFAKRNLHSKLQTYSKYHKQLQFTLETTSSDSVYNLISDPETHSSAQDIQNIAYNNEAVKIFNESIAIENAKNLWNKIEILLSDREKDYLYKHFVLNMSYTDIALEENCCRQLISLKINNAIGRVNKELKLAKAIYTAIEINHTKMQEIMDNFNIKQEDKVEFYSQLYKYIYFDEQLPTGIDTYGYLMYGNHYGQAMTKKYSSKKATKELVD